MTMVLTDRQRDQRNMSPHAEAIAAMSLWSEDYAFKQRGGSMDFWDSPPDFKKNLCRGLVKRIQAAKTEELSTPLSKGIRHDRHSRQA
jgi:hypothetical protein